MHYSQIFFGLDIYIQPDGPLLFEGMRAWQWESQFTEPQQFPLDQLTCKGRTVPVIIGIPKLRPILVLVGGRVRGCDLSSTQVAVVLVMVNLPGSVIGQWLDASAQKLLGFEAVRRHIQNLQQVCLNTLTALRHKALTDMQNTLS